MKAIWKGSLSFGLVNIQVEMHSLSRTNEIKFSLLHKADHSEIRYARICKEEDTEVPWNEIVKGYEIEKGKYIVMTEEEIKKAMPEKTKSIDIVQFTEAEGIDPIYYDKPYVLTPQKGSEKAYALLVEVLKKSGKVGIAQYAIHNRGHIAAIKPYKNAIVVDQLRYKNEVMSLSDLEIPEKQKISSKEVDIGLQLIDQMSADFNPEAFKDTYTETIKQILKSKSKGKKVSPKYEEKVPSKKVTDIMSLLKASLEEKKSRKSSKRKTA